MVNQCQRVIVFMCYGLFSFLFITSATAADSNIDLSSDKARWSYTIGVDLGQNFKNQSVQVEPSIVAEGIKDGLSGQEIQLTKKEMERSLAKFQKAWAVKRDQLSVENKKQGQKFLADNKLKSGIVSLPSGLQYRVVKHGQGRTPSASDIVTVEYTGKFTDGKVFDQSAEPVSFPVEDVIPAWTEALKMMKKGARWEIYAPPKLAFGEAGVLGGPIGPNQTLVYEIQLIDIKSGDKQS